MLSLTRVVATRTTSLMVPKAVAASGISTRMFSIADDLAKKVRYIFAFTPLDASHVSSTFHRRLFAI
jgi:hypothetical protein